MKSRRSVRSAAWWGLLAAWAGLAGCTPPELAGPNDEWNVDGRLPACAAEARAGWPRWGWRRRCEEILDEGFAILRAKAERRMRVEGARGLGIECDTARRAVILRPQQKEWIDRYCAVAGGR
jgi:hypothetical protein